MVNVQTALDNLLVVKIGGGEGLDMARCADDIARIARQRPVVVVHGVSAAMNALCEARGIPVRTLTSPQGHSSRYTDPQTRDVFVEAAHNVNRELVRMLQERGINAQGVTDNNVAISGTRKSAIRAMVDGRRVVVRDDYSGSISDVNTNPLLDLLEQGFTAVLPPLAMSADGLLNIDGDRAAAAVAGALGAEEFVILSNVAGLYRNFPDESSIIRSVNRRELPQAMNYAQGRMKRKVLGAQEAIEGGVHRVVIADGRNSDPVSAALHGAGTEFVA